MSKYLLIAVTFLATNNLKAGDFSSAAETAIAPVTPARLNRSVETTPVRPESHGCLAGLFRRSVQVSPVGGSATVTIEASPVALTRQGSPVAMSEVSIAQLERDVRDMKAFAAWRKECELGTPMLDDSSVHVTPIPFRRK